MKTSLRINQDATVDFFLTPENNLEKRILKMLSVENYTVERLNFKTKDFYSEENIERLEISLEVKPKQEGLPMN